MCSPHCRPDYYDTTGTDLLVSQCSDSRTTLSSYVTTLNGLACSATVRPEALEQFSDGTPLLIGPNHPETLISGAIVPGQLNVVCLPGKLQGPNNSHVQVNDGGNTDTEYVLVVDKKIDLRKGSQLELVAPLDAARVLIYGKSVCKIGDQVDGAGALLCPTKKLKVLGNDAWSGSFLSGNGYVQVGNHSTLTHVPLLFTAP